MSKTLELRKDIVRLLKSEHNEVHYRKAPSTATYPYIVFSISDMGESKELELNYWDRNSNTETIEILADNIETLLDETNITNEHHSITFYNNYDRKFIDDEDKSILRINETFEIRYFGKGV